MFSSGGQKSASRSKHNSNKFKYVNYYLNSKTIWQDQYPPENIEQIYEHCTIHIDEVKRNLENLRELYSIGDDEIIETLIDYSRHLTRLKQVVGISELKSSKTMSDVVKIVNNNIEYTRREQKKAAETMARNQREIEELKVNEGLPIKHIDSNRNETHSKPVPLDDDLFSDEENVFEDKKHEEPSKLDLKNAVSFIQKRRNQNVEPLSNLKRTDPVITPILAKAKKERINVSQETEEDVRVLEKLLETTLKAIDEYAIEMEKIKKLCAIFEKYFLSLYSFIENILEKKQQSSTSMSLTHKDADFEKTSYNKLLSSVVNYEEKRQDYITFIEKCLHKLTRLADTFTDGTHEGISIQRHLSDDSLKLSRRCDCDYVQAALIIPEHNSQLCKCLDYLSQWIEYDRCYAECINDDLRDVEREKKRLTQLRNNAEGSFNQLNHRIKTLKENLDIQVSELKEALKKLSSKLLEDYDEFDGTFIQPTTSKSSSSSSLGNSYNNNSKRPSPTPVVVPPPPKPIINFNHYGRMDCPKMLERVGVDLGELEAELVRQNRVPINSRTKQNVVEEKFRAVVYLRTTLNKLSSLLYSMYDEKSIKQPEIDVWEISYIKLKEIYMCKVNSDTVEKIYYNLGLPTFKVQAIGRSNESESNICSGVFSNFSDSKKSDTFTNVFLIVSNSIGGDWIKLYYSLPFHPVRGKETIKKDIDDVLNNLNRGNMEREQCFVTLTKWRRFNSRANVEDLKKALESIGRNEIVKEINRNLNRDSELKAKEAKKSSLQESDIKKREVEALHQRLMKYLEKTKNGEQATQFDFKFVTKQQPI